MPRHPRPAASTAALSESIFQALSLRLSAHEGPLFPLHLGDSWLEPLEAARAEMQKSAEHEGLHRYALPHGEPALLEAIEERLTARGGAIPRERIQVVSGATVGLSLSCQALLDPGDEVLLPAPYWPLIRGIVAARGAVPVEVSIFTRRGEPGFAMEAALEAAVTPRTAALYLNSPHNPTGGVLGDGELAAIARVAERHDLWVLSDEVYEELWYGQPPPAAAWLREDLAHRTVATHGLSKSHALAGARIGWTQGPASAMAALRRVQTCQVFCAAKPMQAGAVRALRDGAAWLETTRGLYEQAGRLAAEALGLPPPAGGTFLFFDAAPWLDGAPDALPFLERCLDAGVLLTPGASCGADFATWARLCYTTVPLADLEEALARLRRVIG